MPHWYETLFDDRYLTFYDEVLGKGMAMADAEFADTALALQPGSKVLDLGCGVGRHAVPLARMGHQVTGVDLSARMLELAADLAREQEVSLTLERRDMRELDGLGPFDACVCLYTVLGYFDDEENAAVVRAVHEILAPRGTLLLDVTNPLALMPHWPGEHWREGPFGVTREISRYDALTGRLTADRMLIRTDGKRERLPSSVVRMYAPNELRTLLEGYGFVIEQLHGGLRGEPFDWKRSIRQVWVARKG
jgi:2-polyprenyl-3-methyl-5-hydroxy-6-metoxy-1,4-benzoquinol methylase